MDTHSEIRGTAALIRTAVLSAGILLVSCVSQAGPPADEPVQNAGPVIKIQTGHSSPVVRLLALPDGKHFITASTDQSIRIWDVETGKELRRLSGSVSNILAMDVSADGKTVVSAGAWEQTLQVWDVDRGVQTRVIRNEKAIVTAVAISPDGVTAISGDASGNLMRWTLQTGNGTSLGPATGGGVLNLAYAPDGQSVVAVTADGAARLSPVGRYAPPKVFQNEGSKALRAVFSSDSTLLAIGGQAGSIWIKNPATGEQLQEISSDAGDITSLTFAPGDKELVSASADGAIRVWDVASGVESQRFKDPVQKWSTAAVSRDGGVLIAGSTWSTLGAWDMQTQAQLWSFQVPPFATSLAGGMSGGAFAVSIWTSIAGVWDVNQATFEARFNTKTTDWHVTHSVVPRGDTFLVLERAYEGGQLKLRDSADGKVVAQLEDLEKAADSDWTDVTADGEHIAVGSTDGKIIIWKAGTLVPQIDLRQNIQTWGHPFAFSPDGTRFAAILDRTSAGLWESDSGKRVARFELKNQTSCLAFSADGAKVLIGTGNGAAELRGSDGGQLATYYQEAHRTGASSVMLSADGKYAYVGYVDGLIARWNIQTGKVDAWFKGHSFVVNFLRQSADGSRLYSAAQDGTMRAWNAGTGELLYTMMVDYDGEYLAWTPEGYYGGSEKLARERIYVQDGDAVSSMDQYHEIFYRPDLVAEKSAQGRLPQGLNAVSLPALLSRDGMPPKVEILSPEPGPLESRDITLRLRVLDRGGGIGKVTVSLDGMPVVLSEAGRGLNVVKASDTEAQEGTVIEARLSLRGGDNLVEVHASNKAGSIDSTAAARQYSVPEAISGKPRLFLLLVAVQQYRDGALRLAHSIDDAVAFQAAMSRSSGSLYREVVARRLFDADATRAAFDGAFDEMGAQVKPEDVFMLYFAGHGVASEEDGEYYFLPVDFRYKDRASIPEQGISKNEILDGLLKVHAEKSVLLFDTCNSGSFLAQPSTRGLTEKTAVDRLKRAIGRVMIVASSDTQVAMEGYRGHGVFTWALLEGIAGKADGDGNGYVSVKELSTYVENAVPEITYATWGYEQVPQSLLPREDFPLVPSGAR
jgi:WD40 repeat protein